MIRAPLIRSSLNMTPITGATEFSTTNVNSATTFIAFSFLSLKNDTLESIHLNFGKSGTPTDVRLALYADSGGYPSGTALTESGSVSVPYNGFYVVPLSYAVVANTRYWIAVKNYTATPGSNYPVVNYTLTPFPNIGEFSNHTTYGYNRTITTTGDGGWSAPGVNAFGMQFNMASGLKLGGCIKASYVSMNASSNVEAGNVFISPDVCINVDTISGLLYKKGSPISDVTAKVYINGSLVATSLSINGSQLTTTNLLASFVFADTVAIPPRSTVRVSLNFGTTDASNYYRIGKTEFDVNERDIFPYSIQGWASTDGGTSWSIQTGVVYNLSLGLVSGMLGLEPPINRRTSTGR